MRNRKPERDGARWGSANFQKKIMRDRFPHHPPSRAELWRSRCVVNIILFQHTYRSLTKFSFGINFNLEARFFYGRQNVIHKKPRDFQGEPLDIRLCIGCRVSRLSARHIPRDGEDRDSSECGKSSTGTPLECTWSDKR